MHRYCRITTSHSQHGSVLDHEQPTHIVPRLDGSAGTCGVSTDVMCSSSSDHKSTPLQRLQREVQELHHKLAARDHEIHSLKEIAEAVKELQSQDAQAAKVIELSKKVKALVPMPYIGHSKCTQYAHRADGYHGPFSSLYCCCSEPSNQPVL